MQVKAHVTEQCSKIFDCALLEETIGSVEGVVHGWLREVYGEWPTAGHWKQRWSFLVRHWVTVHIGP